MFLFGSISRRGFFRQAVFCRRGAVYLAGNFLRESFPDGQIYRVKFPGDLRGNFICLVLEQI